MGISREELDREIDDLAETILEAREAQIKARKARERLIQIVTNPEYNQGTDREPRYRTSKWNIMFFLVETLRGKPSQVIRWISTHFKDPKEQQEILDQLFRAEVSRRGLEMIQQKGKRTESLKKLLERKSAWRVSIRGINETES